MGEIITEALHVWETLGDVLKIAYNEHMAEDDETALDDLGFAYGGAYTLSVLCDNRKPLVERQQLAHTLGALSVYRDKGDPSK